MSWVKYNLLGRAYRALTGQTADLLKMQDVNGNTLAAFEPAGTLRFENDGTVWDDVRIVPSAFDFAGNSDPTLTTWQPGGSGTTYRVYAFQKGDEAFFSCQIPHAVKQGSTIYAHVHWSPRDRGVTEAGAVVAWGLDYSFANIHGVFPSSSNLPLPSICTGTNDLHEISPDLAITTPDLSLSSMLICRLYRDTTGDTWAGSQVATSPILLEFDLHVEIDTLGSRLIRTK